MITLDLPDLAATQALASRLAATLPDSPMVVYLEGDLGAGKTTLVRAMLRAMGVVGAIRSPTYTLIEPYELPGRNVFHLDLYRISEPEELEYLGVRELAGPGVLLYVEWPSHGQDVLPAADIELRITPQQQGANEATGEGRHIVMLPHSPAGAAWLEALKREGAAVIS